MPLELQAKLLRVLQEREVDRVGGSRPLPVDVRIVAATNADLGRSVEEGRFRRDFFYRVNVFTLTLPPLRDRPMDIAPLAQALLDQGRRDLGIAIEGFTEEAMASLCAYRWPGNGRELKNEVLRMLALADGPRLGADLLSGRVLRGGDEADERELEVLAKLEGGLKERLEQLEARIVKETLVRHRWNKTRAAEELGLSRVGLRSKLARYGLERG